VAKRKKERTSPAKVSRLIRRFWLPAGLAIVALCLALGTSALLKRAKRNAVLYRLPEMPDLGDKTETLRQNVAAADQVVRQVLESGPVNERFGRKAGELGKLYQANHFYDQAIRCYQLATEFDPENARWFYLLAFVYQEMGENESVSGPLEHTVRLAPRYSPAILKLADNYFKRRETDKAQAHYERRLDLLPGDPYALLGLARIALDASQWETAQAYLEKAIESDSKFGAAHRMLASVHEHFGRTGEMQEALDRAAQCTPFRPAPDPWIDALQDLCYDTEQLLVLGSKAVTSVEIETALEVYRRAMELDPKNPKAYLAMGKLWVMLGQKTQAREFFEKTIDLDPKSELAYFQLGLILRSEHKLRQAEQMFLKALDLDPNNPKTYNNLGVCLLEQERFQQAVGCLNKALEVDPEHIEARYNLAMSLWGLGKTEEAIGQYYHVLQLKPKWAKAANSLAWILATDRNAGIRNGDEAVQWAMVACKGEGRKNPEYLDTLAAAYAEAGHFTKALETAQRSLMIAKTIGDTELFYEVRHRLQLYKRGKAFHR
jgi:tetratricopeptide (TPR) repeat protein